MSSEAQWLGTRAGEWLGIESCPDTGEYVMLYDGEFVSVGWRQPGTDEITFELHCDVGYSAATHWMPMPKAPA